MKQLRRLRLQRGYSLRYVGFKLGIDPTHLCKMETGQRKPSLTVLKKLADFYNCPVEHIFNDFFDNITITQKDTTRKE